MGIAPGASPGAACARLTAVRGRPVAMNTTFALARLPLAAGSFAASLAAQCANAWESFGTLPGVNGSVRAVAEWDPDGAGPLPSRVVVAGSFSLAGAVAADQVAAWDPATGTWSALGAGVAGQQQAVNVLLALPSGELIAGGSCSSTGGSAVHPLLRWTGTTWAPFGGLTPGPQVGVTALVRLPSGALAVGGSFTSAGATALPFVGIWNGTAWSSLGGSVNGPVDELTVTPNGDLV